MKQTLETLLQSKIVILDGATGTNLQKKGLTGGICPEQWVREHPEVITELQQAYVAAGSDIVYASTFSGNAIKLGEYGLADQVDTLNRELVAISKAAVGDQALVAGDMTMTGQQLEPLGELSFDELLACYIEQAKALDAADVDLFVVETMMSVAETKAAILAIHEVSDKPIIVTMTFEANGRTLYGTDPVTALVTLQALGIEAFGINCSSGPETMITYIKAMKPYAKVPLIVKANAGLPIFVDGETVFPMQPEEYAEAAKGLIEAGASVAGGCCGTTPAHIQAVAEKVAGLCPAAPCAAIDYPIATTERKMYPFEDGFEDLTIGTKICAATDEELADDLENGMFDTMYDLLDEEADDESDIILVDIDPPVAGAYNVAALVQDLIQELGTAMAPIAFTSSDEAAVEQYLKLYTGRALIRIKAGNDEVHIHALVRKYGAILI